VSAFGLSRAPYGLREPQDLGNFEQRCDNQSERCRSQ